MFHEGWLCLALLLGLLAFNRKENLDTAAAANELGGVVDKLPTPAFPRLFLDPVRVVPIWPKRAKIITEVIGGDFRRTNAEYLDLDLGKAAYVLQNGPDGAGSEVVLSDHNLMKMFKYKPYTCESLPLHDSNLDGLDYWSTEVDIGSTAHLTSEPSRKLRLFGLAALWIYAEESPKRYKRSSTVYSAGKDLYRSSHTWTIVDERLDLNIKYSFISATFSQESTASEKLMNQINNQLSLELVQIESRKSAKVLRTINVLSIEYDLSLTEYNNILKVPLGYGCITSLGDYYGHEDSAQELANLEDRFWFSYLFSSSKVDLEVTGTKIDAATSERSTDTIYAEVAHMMITANNYSKVYDLLMTRVKSKDVEVKTVENHLNNVKYQIDLQRGSCSMSHIARPLGEQEVKPVVEEQLLNFKFANGLELALSKATLSKLFAASTSNFKTIIKGDLIAVDNNRKRRNVFLENTISWPLGAGGNASNSDKVARLIQTYTEESAVTESGAPDSSLRLTSVTIWVLERATQSRILEIYHLNIIDEEGPLFTWPHVGTHFDVSQECYLDNENMRSGTDYAWVEFHFPLASRHLDLLAEDDTELKRLVHRTLLHRYALTAPRLPRLELMYGDEALVARALFLDLPDIPLLYESYKNKMIVLQSEMGDLQFLAPDLKHCSTLCQQYECKSMSFCSDTRWCLLSSLVVDPKLAEPTKPKGERQVLRNNENCMTYSPSEVVVEHLKSPEYKWRLRDLLAILSHKHYDLELPQAPEELTLPPSETGISERDYRAAVSSYMDGVYEFLNNKGDKAPLLITMTLGSEYLILMPSRFVVENDPLDGFGLTQDADTDIFFDTNKVVSFFHVGVYISRYIFNAFRGELRDRSSLLTGLSYDQCALGCIDSRCGTFSYCANRKECILTSFDTISEATHNDLVEVDHDCFIAQRDFARNYQKFPNCERPKHYHAATRKETVSDCALACLRTNEPNCMSFEYCQPASTKAKGESTNEENCFVQLARQPDELFAIAAKSAKQQQQAANSSDAEPPQTGCDHYERSHLAEFNLIEARAVNVQMINKLKTTKVLSATTPMECAEVCLNEENDCSAFQFCFELASNKSSSPDSNYEPFRYSHSCITIQSRPEDAKERQDFEALIDEKDDMLAEPNKYLDYHPNCHVYALRPDIIQAHLRDLAMGNTMTVAQRARLDALNETGGTRISWAGFIFMFLSVALCSALAGVGLCYAREKSPYVRSRLERVSYQVDQLRGRLHL